MEHYGVLANGHQRAAEVLNDKLLIEEYKGKRGAIFTFNGTGRSHCVVKTDPALVLVLCFLLMLLSSWWEEEKATCIFKVHSAPVCPCSSMVTWQKLNALQKPGEEGRGARGGLGSALLGSTGGYLAVIRLSVTVIPITGILTRLVGASGSNGVPV